MMDRSCMACKHSRQGEHYVVCKNSISPNFNKSIYWTDECENFDDAKFEFMSKEQRLDSGYIKVGTKWYLPKI